MDRDVAILAGNAVGVGFFPGQPGQGGQQVDADGGCANDSFQETEVRIQKEGGIYKRSFGIQVVELNNASSSLKSGCRSIVLISEEFNGGKAGGGGLLEPMLEIAPGGLGIPEGTAV